ncbi:hypothetical protein L6164_011215 [Bauhinia variegata]|uniref:Uncharacterized protein n=1 Tax=Bauhinia variegata TaxID=167791 RepID=A0ACB9P7I8_BAUVA|nr:hypothetical protein L6164_011215 [Bauhinia variegata]
MENKLNQRRVSFSDPPSQKHEELSGHKGDKGWNWFRRPLLMEDDRRNDEHVAAVAAAAFAVHSLEEAGLLNLRMMREGPESSRTRTMRRKEDSISRTPSYAGETPRTKSFGQKPRQAESAFPVSHRIPVPSPKPSKQMHQNNFQRRADAWEKAKGEKIQKRYDKIKSRILSWENERKMETKLKMEKKKSALDHKRAMEQLHYKNKMARIEKIAEGARAQLEDKRRKEESKASEKAKIIRTTGRVPIKCFCFNY